MIACCYVTQHSVVYKHKKQKEFSISSMKISVGISHRRQIFLGLGHKMSFWCIVKVTSILVQQPSFLINPSLAFVTVGVAPFKTLRPADVSRNFCCLISLVVFLNYYHSDINSGSGTWYPWELLIHFHAIWWPFLVLGS